MAVTTSGIRYSMMNVPAVVHYKGTRGKNPETFFGVKIWQVGCYVHILSIRLVRTTPPFLASKRGFASIIKQLSNKLGSQFAEPAQNNKKLNNNVNVHKKNNGNGYISGSCVLRLSGWREYRLLRSGLHNY